MRETLGNDRMSSNQSGEGDILATLRDMLLPKLFSGKLSTIESTQ